VTGAVRVAARHEDGSSRIAAHGSPAPCGADENVALLQALLALTVCSRVRGRRWGRGRNRMLALSLGSVAHAIHVAVVRR